MQLRSMFRFDPVALSIIGVYFVLSLVLSWTKLLSLWYQIPVLGVGLLLGMLVPQIDRLFLHHLYRSDESSGLVTQSMVFLGLFFPVSLFVVTSTGSIFGGGVVIGLLAQTLATFLKLRQNPQELDRVFFFQLQRSLTEIERQIVFGAILLWSVIVWLFALL